VASGREAVRPSRPRWPPCPWVTTLLGLEK
jgi:hypothetical protein